VKAVETALDRGLIPQVIGTSRPIRPGCQAFLDDLGMLASETVRFLK
jgi:hypothetical protein